LGEFNVLSVPFILCGVQTDHRFSEKRNAYSENKFVQNINYKYHYDLKLLFETCLTASVVRVPGYRSRGPGSITGATRFSEKQWVWNTLVNTNEELLERKSSGSSLETEITAVGDLLH
jgi:hypothetical protein